MKKIKLSVAALLIAGVGFAQTQCVGVTKSNNQCKNITKDLSKLCHVHDTKYVKKTKLKSVVCSGITKKGNNCKNKTKDSSGFCHLHRKND